MLKKVLTIALLSIMLLVTVSSRAETKSGCALSEDWGNLPVPRVGLRQINMMPSYWWMFNFVWVHVPEIPGCILDMLCYEHNGDLLTHRQLDGGALELRHRPVEDPNILWVTTITPEPGAVEVIVRAEVDKQRFPQGSLPKELPIPNLCLRVKRPAEDLCFSCYPDPFPEFISRCFIFTFKGQTFLNDIFRRKMSRLPSDDPRNNPPWIQSYTAAKPTAAGWPDDTNRFTIPVIGVVSRDRKHLAALATDSAERLAQAWQQCLHNFWEWQPKDAPPERQYLRMKIYIMPNDPDMLLARVEKDFPNAAKLKGKRVPETNPR